MNEEILIPYRYDVRGYAPTARELEPKKRFVETRATVGETRRRSVDSGEQYSMGGLGALTFGLGLWLGLSVFGRSDARRRGERRRSRR